jgi:capsular polysaccharide biosynthesis protein
VDLNEAFRRIFYAHRRLIVMSVILGIAGGIALASMSPASYTASVRLTIGDRSADVSVDPVTIADAAEAIATSRSVLTSATQASGLGDVEVVDPAAVSVTTLGSSELLELSVSAGDAATATALANAVADELVDRWTEVAGQGGQAVALVQGALDDVLATIANLDERIAVLGVRLNQASAAEQERMQARRDALVTQREASDRQRVTYEAQIEALLVDAAGRSAPQVIDPAVPPSSADPRHLVPMAVLGALLGFLVGAGTAGLIEAVSPTLVGAAAIGDALGVPVLGTLPRPGDRNSQRARRAVANSRLVLRRTKVTTLELVAMGPSIDLEPLAATLEGDEGPSDSDRAAGRRGRGQFVVRGFGVDVVVPANASRTSTATVAALVAVSPSVVKRSFVREIHDAQAVTGWELLGVLAYDRADRRAMRARKPRTRPAPAPELASKAS